MKRIVIASIAAFLVCSSSLVFGQYEEEPFMEGFVGGNVTFPFGYMKNDLIPDSLNATVGFGLDAGAGYYFTDKIIAGPYFGLRNMGTSELKLSHRIFEFGLYGKYLLSEVAENKITPYFKLSAGLAVGKLATEVWGEGGSLVFRELSYDPTVTAGAALGAHYKVNSTGGVYAEMAYLIDFMDGVTGGFKSVDYAWGGNNNYLIFRAGIQFNVGPKE